MAVNKLWIVLFLIPFCCFAQNSEKLPLALILKDIAEAHNVKFSYIDEELKVYKLAPPKKTLPLNEKLAYLERSTRLKFEALNDTYYTVSNDIRMDKPLCGYLIDADTGFGIENATVTVSGTGIAVASGAGGYFTLPTLTPNTLTISHLGYETKNIEPQDLYVPDCPVIKLTPTVIEMQEAVTDRYLATGISKSTSGELIVKPRRFGILPGLTEPDVLQTMQQLPGVSSIDETVSNINVRGGTHDQNLFLWNGVRMYQTAHFFGLLSAFNPLPATNISIYKNGSPAFYGEGVSSLVNISTRMAVPDSTTTTIAADMISVNFLSSLKLSEKSSLQFSARRSYADVFTTPAFRQYEERVFQNTTITDVTDNLEVPIQSTEDFHFYDFSLQYQQQIGKHELFLNGIGVENKIDISQATAAASRTGNLGQKNFGGSLTIRSKWSDKHSTDVEAYVSWYDLSAYNEEIENEQSTNQQNSVLDLGLRTRYTYSGFKNLKVSTGYQLNEVGVTNFDEVNIPAFSRKSKEVSLSHAIVGEGVYTSENGLTNITGGMRVNYFEKFRLILPEPRLSFTQDISNTLRLEVLGEQKSQTVSQVIDQQQDFLGIEKRRWMLANDNDVPVQKSSQGSVGLLYNYNGWLASAEGFYKSVAGISSSSQGFQNQFEFEDTTGDYSVAGAEFLLQKSFSRFYTWLTYTYNDNQYNFEGYVPPGFANNFAVSHTFGFAGIYEWNKLRVALGSRWRTGKPITEPFAFTIDPDNPSNSQVLYNTPNSARIEDNLQLNFSAAKTWDFKNGVAFSASCSVLNVLDRQNLINRYYRINRGNNSVEAINTYSLGRTPNLSVKLVF